MHILIATGIYPPDIGGPATYAQKLAEALTLAGHRVTVLAYGRDATATEQSTVHRVEKRLPILRWFRYASALKRLGEHADIVYALSSVSCGMPLMLSSLTKPRRVLRLGGDFFWERYTDLGGTLSLREWYASPLSFLWRFIMLQILRSFDVLIFSTEFQRTLYRERFSSLPDTAVIENARERGHPIPHTLHSPFRLLSYGRFVAFKNLSSLIRAMTTLTSATLTLVGDGPEAQALKGLVQSLGLQERISFLPPLSGSAQSELFSRHDLLVIPSLTDISPNAALEAVSHGLPVLLTCETGLSDDLLTGIETAQLQTPDDIVHAVCDIQARYEEISQAARLSRTERTWDTLCTDHIRLFSDLLP